MEFIHIVYVTYALNCSCRHTGTDFIHTMDSAIISGLRFPVPTALATTFWTLSRVSYTRGYISGNPNKASAVFNQKKRTSKLGLLTGHPISVTRFSITSVKLLWLVSRLMVLWLTRVEERIIVALYCRHVLVRRICFWWMGSPRLVEGYRPCMMDCQCLTRFQDGRYEFSYYENWKEIYSTE